jgi:antitoxin (DNA-binding transcriptional repressor) of toxin-antitoxin stability system
VITITTREIERDLLGFLQRVKAGERLIILDADKPLAEVRPLVPDASELRPYALCAGEFEVPDDFDAPLPDEVLALFEGD